MIKYIVILISFHTQDEEGQRNADTPSGCSLPESLFPFFRYRVCLKMTADMELGPWLWPTGFMGPYIRTPVTSFTEIIPPLVNYPWINRWCVSECTQLSNRERRLGNACVIACIKDKWTRDRLHRSWLTASFAVQSHIHAHNTVLRMDTVLCRPVLVST